MITKPTIPQLITTLQTELAENVLPLIEDPTARVNVEMVTALLSALSVRTENEVAWMIEEAAAIEATALRLLPSLTDGTAVDAALAAHRDAPPASMRLSDVSESYERASELLSVLSEAAYASGDSAAISEVQGLVESRLAIEMEAIGEFVAVGRS